MLVNNDMAIKPGKSLTTCNNETGVTGSAPARQGDAYKSASKLVIKSVEREANKMFSKL